MPELFLELFSEEIPARMQARAAKDLERLLEEGLVQLAPGLIKTFYGPRRIAVEAFVLPEVPAARRLERGPRITAPQQALDGFLRKHSGSSRDDVRQEEGYWVLDKVTGTSSAIAIIATALPAMLRRFPWPKSMRWGGTSSFVWVRPLRRIVCLLDGVVVPFDLRDGDDDGHGLASANVTEGHRFHGPGAFPVASCEDWEAKLRDRRVIVDADDRKRIIRGGIAALAEKRQLAIVDDPGLLDEVAGLVEWPVPLIGRIDHAYMDLPPEVRQVSMRVNQRYFAFRNADGSAAPYFGFVDNIEPSDGGVVSIAGNERVLRARFADARHFWDLDRRARLESRVPQLDHVTFHAKLGSQGERVRRLERLAEEIGPLVGAGQALARDAARLAKADLVTGMVGEFPELQGVMGRYYARGEGLPAAVAEAIGDHYAPAGPNDRCPSAPVSIAVALADKLDALTSFWAIGEKPTGSRDPFALRRAALGVIRIVLENKRRLPLGEFFKEPDLMGFFADRLKVQARDRGTRHDVIDAVFALGGEDDLVRLMARVEALQAFLGSEAGGNLLAGYKRAVNIVRAEEKKDKTLAAKVAGAPDVALLEQIEEKAVASTLAEIERSVTPALAREDFTSAMATFATLRAPIDAFFEKVTVNVAERPELRLNRLKLLNQIRATLDSVADFSKIEG
jgi:glycyl-tRNA synthetase beta chain